MYLGGVRSKGSGGDAGRWARILHKPQRSRSPLCSGVSWEDNNNPPACTAACTPARRPHPAAPPPGRDHRDPPNIPPATSSAKQPPNFLHRSRPSALFLPKPKAFWWRGNPPAPARRVRKSPSPPAEGVGARWDPPPVRRFYCPQPGRDKRPAVIWMMGKLRHGEPGCSHPVGAFPRVRGRSREGGHPGAVVPPRACGNCRRGETMGGEVKAAGGGGAQLVLGAACAWQGFVFPLPAAAGVQGGRARQVGVQGRRAKLRSFSLPQFTPNWGFSVAGEGGTQCRHSPGSRGMDWFCMHRVCQV